MSRKVPTICAYCEGDMLVAPSHYGRVRFCSPDCRTAGKTTVLTCAHCDVPFRVVPADVARRRYCSRPCKAAAQDQGLTTANYRERHSAEYRAWRTAVFRRDDFTCQMCSVRGGYLEADHIKQWAFFPELRFDVDNGRTLCKPCHNSVPVIRRMPASEGAMP